ncbi:MAG TPA: phosphoribosylglycinamide formyltransferase [Planctomycetota bacterium]|nr:phosphoribosylglycinamide formyltransferase [Planctomycetota bacterium]
MNAPVHLGILLSGSGRTLQNLVDRIADGSLNARIEIVVSSDPEAFGLERARKAGIPTAIVARKAFRDAEHHSREVTRALEAHPIDLVIMAGYLHLYLFPQKWAGRVLNIHPALLPDFGGKGFYGHKVHEAVIRKGVPESGCTVHFADHQYDHGGVILQKRVPVLPGDTPETLAERVFQAECEAYPEAIRKVAAGVVLSR